jgi:CubicO group peptidase (beta-lactamase class C family)
VNTDASHDSTSGLPRGVSGAADRTFTPAVRGFAGLFGGPRSGGGALAVYLDATPVVDVWTGCADRRGTRPWSADTGTVIFSATKGVTTTVIHRLVDRGLIDYDVPMAHYWPEFAGCGKSKITVRDVMGHRAGLSQLNGVGKADVMDHRLMEHRCAAAPAGHLLGKSAYHALTYGWLMSGLARSVTGKGMRELIRREVAEPLGTDGLHLGRPPAGAPTSVAEILAPAMTLHPAVNTAASRLAGLRRSGGLGAIYFPGIETVVQDRIPLLDTEFPAANAVASARALARMYGAIANGGTIGGTRLLSSELVAGLTARRSLRIDHNLYLPVGFHLGYHAVPAPGVMPGFGHVGMGGSIGWADPATGLAFAFVHNRLRISTALLHQTAFLWLNTLIRWGAARARRRGYQPVADFGPPFPGPQAAA